MSEKEWNRITDTTKPILYQHAAEKGYPLGAIATCPKCHSSRQVFTSELAEWFAKGFPRCRKDGARIDIQPVKHCSRCNEDRPKSDFTVCRSRPDGLSYYCRFCTRKKNRVARKEKRAYRRRIPVPIEAKGAVYSAIQKGAHSQDAIRLQISRQITTDEICDALASLYDEGMLDRSALKRREYRSVEI